MKTRQKGGENTFDLFLFSRACKKARTERKMNQYQAADAVGVSQSMYSNFESGGRKPSSASLSKICEFYGFDPSDFFVLKQHVSAIGEKIVEVRDARNYSDTQMRRYLGLSSNVYQSLLFLGKSRVDVIARVCETLHIPVSDDYFLSDDSVRREEDRENK
jgi:DNA-binding XRE family transcriptional regulator